MYKELREAGVTQVICDFCASAFQVKSSLEGNKAPLTAEYKGHPSIAKWVDRGYQVIVLSAFLPKGAYRAEYHGFLSRG